MAIAKTAAAKKATSEAKGGKEKARRAPVKEKAFRNTLVVVESPAKAKTIKKYLGSGYTVKASVGHIMDLPKSKMGVDIENGFEPQYESAPRPLRRARAERRRPPRRRTREGDRRVRSGRVLVDRGGPERGASAAVPRQADQAGREEDRARLARDHPSARRRAEEASLHRRVRGEEGASAERARALHHQQAAAGGGEPPRLLAQEDDDARAAVVRGCRAGGRRSGRAHHLHAY